MVDVVNVKWEEIMSNFGLGCCVFIVVVVVFGIVGLVFVGGY